MKGTTSMTLYLVSSKPIPFWKGFYSFLPRGTHSFILENFYRREVKVVLTVASHEMYPLSYTLPIINASTLWLMFLHHSCKRRPPHCLYSVKMLRFSSLFSKNNCSSVCKCLSCIFNVYILLRGMDTPPKEINLTLKYFPPFSLGLLLKKKKTVFYFLYAKSTFESFQIFKYNFLSLNLFHL